GSEPIDLSTWTIDIYLDGSPVPSKSIALSGTILPGETFTIVRDKADPELLALADMVSSQLKFNGNDAIVLRNGPDPILDAVDHIGQVGYDPITEWGSGLTSTRDNTLSRDPSVTAPDPNIFAVFDPSAEWVGFPKDYFGGIGVPPTAVPEPTPLALLLTGIVFLAARESRRPRPRD
ncbi:MAG: PEP-CTERM sorting domain-containing protein, partial [Myxococcota bacterium]